MINQPEFRRDGLVRLKDILAPKGPIPVSKSTWWKGVSDGRFPQPHKRGQGITMWRVEEIRALFEEPSQVKPDLSNA
jgi:predicted DNA-binding transcriptional regulator AlpA